MKKTLDIYVVITKSNKVKDDIVGAYTSYEDAKNEYQRRKDQFKRWANGSRIKDCEWDDHYIVIDLDYNEKYEIIIAKTKLD